MSPADEECWTEEEFQQELRGFRREVRQLRQRVWLRNRLPALLLVLLAAALVRVATP